MSYPQLRTLDEFDTGVAARVVALRRARGLRQADVARLLGLHQMAMSQLERGRRRLGFDEAVLLAAEWDIDLNDLVP